MFAKTLISRRSTLTAGTSVVMAAASGWLPSEANARGRLSQGGRIGMRLPWPIQTTDPHRLDDTAAAIFGDALFDTLYARDRSGNVTPILAETLPEPDGASTRVRLRSGLRTASGRPFTGHDAAWSIARARGLGARAWLADVPSPKPDEKSITFATRDTTRILRALTSSLVAMLPSNFNESAPDGTGPMRLVARGGSTFLLRNAFAARGPSRLKEVELRPAQDLAASLRAFESGADDVGWLGSGLHEPRRGSRPFDFGPVGWAVLFTGHEALTWDAPGVAQRLCDGIPPSRLEHLALGAPWASLPDQGWGGPQCSIIVRDDAPWLIEVARGVAATISRPAREVTVKPVPTAEFVQRRTTRSHALALDFVRSIATDTFAAMVALATADNASGAGALVEHPPRLPAEAGARSVTRLMRCGVVGEVRVKGATASDVWLSPSPACGFDFGAASRGATP